jgi:hypothetical protein
MSRKIQFAFLLLVLISTATQSAFAQANPPLNFGNNFFVTGDYVVAGAYGMNSHLNGGFATGTISIPDANPLTGAPNPGIRGTTTVPRGANIIAALLYWQTVEKVGDLGTGQNGFFGPVFNNVPQLHAISGENLPSHSTVSFSSGGCSGGSTGKIVQTYRADVRGFLPLDANGNVLVDSADGVTFEVRLPSVGTQTPLTLGATLVLIYRVVSPNFPLNVITILDGAFAPSSAIGLTMSLPIQGFYGAGNSLVPGNNVPVWKLTHIVGSGQSNKFQTVSLTGGKGINNQRQPAIALRSPYGVGQPAFPGWYGGEWDNTTWSSLDPLPVNPLQEFDDSATTTVTPTSSQMGCVSWGAVILSTTVDDPDKDGILPVWKNNKGYTDVATGVHVSLDDLSDEPQTGQQDIFIQMDHVEDVNGKFIPDPVAVSMVHDAFKAHNIHLHFTDASQTTGIANANIISEPGCTDKPLNNPPFYCPFPNQPGITTWRYGFEFVKNQPINYPDESSCEQAPLNGTPGPDSGPCVRRFPIAQRNSHHYVVFGDTLGADNWTFFAGKLTNSNAPGTGPGVVSQAGNTVTFYTSKGHGLTVDNVNHTLANGRVTVSNAITDPNLNGTFFVTGTTCPVNPATKPPTGPDCTVQNTAPGPYIFQITIPGNAVTTGYTRETDPYLAVASGQASSGSGLSDIGGMGTLVTLGKWGANATLSAKAGTLMHELGHTLGLSLHGGSYYDGLGINPNDYRPVIEDNCKPNYRSVMSYLFQARLVGSNGVLDFSDQQLSTLTETSLLGVSGIITSKDTPIDTSIFGTSWYDTQPAASIPIAGSPGGATESGYLVTINTTSPHGLIPGQSVAIFNVGPGYNGIATVVSAPNSKQFTYFAGISGLPASGGGTVGIGTLATHHCDDSALNSTDPPTFFYNQGATTTSADISVPWSANSLDVNFDDGTPDNPPLPLRGYNDWANIDPRQVGGTGSSLLGPGGLLNGGPGGLFGGPGGLFGGPGGLFGGPGGLFGGPGGLFGGPGGLFGGPGGLFGGPGELDFANAVSVKPGPTALSAFEEASPRKIDLTWTEPNFPATAKNNIYRDAHDGNGFVLIHSVTGTAPGTPNTFQDIVVCNPNGYTYDVTDVVNISPAGNPPQFQQSSPASVSVGQKMEPLTGCYLPPVFSSPAAGSSPLQGSTVTVTWTLPDKSNSSGVTFANNPGSNTLFAIGPTSNDVSCVPGSVPVGTPRSPISSAGNPITFSANQFSVSWNTTVGFVGGQNLLAGAFPPGCYLLEDDLDSGQPGVDNELASAFQVQIYLSDMNESVLVNTPPLPDAVKGVLYNQPLQETGGVAPLTWKLATGSGALPPGILLSASGTLTGTPTAAGTYTFTVQATDSIGDFGTQTLTLVVDTVVTNNLDGGAGSLRQAILDVNAAVPGPQPLRITFNIPSAEQTISPATALPALAQPTILDGTTQPGSGGIPVIVVNGTTASQAAAPAAVNGIHLTAGSITVRGLVVQNFSGDGILIDTNGGDVIQGNYIGTDATGTIAAPNGGSAGIQLIDTTNNLIGGPTSAARNIISGNVGEGVRIDGALATGNVIQGNYIGTDVTGSVAVGNSASGVYIRRAPGNSVIGNTVSGNLGFAGVTICGNQLSVPPFCGGGDNSGPGTPGSNAAGNIVRGNFVGTNSAGTTALGNNQAGVSIDGAPNTVVGGTAAGTPNTISFNGTNDVQIFDPGATGNLIQGNTVRGSGANNDVGISVGVLSNTTLTANTLTGNLISGHFGLGIDLNPVGVNSNTSGGANNFPVISSASVGSGTISGTLDGPSSAKFTVEFFSNVACNGSGNGEGAVFLGSTSVTTNGNPLAPASFNFPFAGLMANTTIITATSTDAFGTTSEFSGCFTATQ